MEITKLGSDRVQTSDAAQTQKSQASKAAEKSAEQNSTAQANSAAKSSVASNVKWSSEAKLANEALAIAKAAPDTRADKVATIKAAVANGTYKVDSKAVADRMIERSIEDDLLTRNG